MSDDRRDGNGMGEGDGTGAGGRRGGRSAAEPVIEPGSGAAAAAESGHEVAGERPDGLAPPPSKGAGIATWGCIGIFVLMAIIIALVVGTR